MPGPFVRPRPRALPSPAIRPLRTVFLAARLHVDLLRLCGALCRG